MSTTGEQSTVVEVLQQATLLKDTFNFESILPNGKPDLNTFDLRVAYVCPQGMVSVDDTSGAYTCSNTH